MASPESWRSPTWRHAPPGELAERVNGDALTSIARNRDVCPTGCLPPTTISGACQTPITPLAVPSQRHREPLTPERWWDLIRVRRWPGSVLICERGSGVRMDCLPAIQSAIFAFSEEDSRIARMFANFVRLKGTAESEFR